MMSCKCASFNFKNAHADMGAQIGGCLRKGNCDGGGPLSWGRESRIIKTGGFGKRIVCIVGGAREINKILEF